MLSRNNWKEQVRQQEPKKQRFTIKKLTIGVASVLIGFTFMGMSASADNQTTPATGSHEPIDTTQAGKPIPPAPSATDTTTPIAPSTTVPSYDGTKVVDTPFYNNPQGTNSKLIDNKSKDGQYNIYFTAKDASGKEYASSYAVEKSNAPIHSLLDKDAGAYDPNSLELHFYYQNNGDQDQTINYTLRMPDWINPYLGNPESSLVPDSSRINDVKVTSKQGNTYDISSVTKTLDGVESRDGDLRRVKDVPVNLTVKANDAINLVIPFVLNTTAKESNTKINDNNDFYVLENGQQTGHLNVRSSTYAPLYPEDKIYPAVNVGNNNYTHEYPDNPGPLNLDPSVFSDEDFLNGYPNDIYNASTPTNKSTVYGSYTFSYLSLNKYEDYLTKHGFTVTFSNGKPKPYYTYTLSVIGAKLVDKNGNPVQDENKGHPYKGHRYFEVVPVILLNPDETYTTKTAPTAWDPSTMVNKVADPTNYRYWDQKTDSAVRKDNTAAQLTAKDFTVTITRDGQDVNPDANRKYDLSKPGTYTVTYSRDFNGTTISNSGQITVTPVEDTTVTYTFYDETDKKPVEGHDVTVTGQPGTDQKVNLTTPEGYKLAEGQTLPTSVTIPNANETITIHLVHATKDNQKYEVNYVPMDIERPTTDTSVTKTQMPTVTNADTMPDGTIIYKQKIFDAPKGVTTSVDSKTGELTVTVEKDATTGPFLVPVDISYQDGSRGIICYVPVKIHDKIDTNDQTVQISLSLTSPIVNLHRTTDNNTNIDVNNSRINTIDVYYDWDHTSGNGNYRKTIVYKLNADGTKFVNTTDPTDSFDASGFKYEWRKGYAPNTKFGTGTGTVLAQNNGVFNPEAMYRMNYTITDPSVTRKLNLPTNFSTYKTVFFNFWGATTGQPLTFNQNQDISNLSQAQYRQLIDVTDLGANGWNGTNVDPSTPHYTPGTDPTKTFSMAWAPNGQPSTATVADGVKGTVRINFNDGTYLDVPAIINVVNTDQYIPSYKDTTVTYTFYDETDKKPVEGHDVTVTGQPGTDQKVNLTTPEGYKLAEGQTLPTSVMMPKANETITINLVHATKDIKPNDPGVNPSDPVYADMFKTVTRTIKVNNPDRMVDTTTQQVNFNRTKTIDEVTDEVISYGNWTLATGSAKDWGQFNVPQLDGFISYVDGNAAKEVAEENVTADTADVTVEVTYKNSDNNTNPGDDGNHNTNPGDNGNHNTNPGNNGNHNTNPGNNGNHNTNPGNNGNHNTNPGNNNGINNGTQNGNGNKTVNTNVTDNGNGDKTVNTNVTDNGNGDNSQNNKQALPQTGNTKNDAAVAGLGLAGLLAMLGLGGLKKKRN